MRLDLDLADEETAGMVATIVVLFIFLLFVVFIVNNGCDISPDLFGVFC